MEHEQHHCTQHEHKQQEPEVVAEVEELEEEEEEEEEDGGLERRKFFPKSKDISSFSSYSNGGGNGVEHSNGVFSVVNGTDGSHIHKEEEQEEDGENGNHLKNDETDSEAVGLGIVAEIVGAAAAAATNGDSGSHKINSVYFDKQQGNEVNGSQNGDHAGLVLPTNHVEEDAVIPNGISNEVNNGYTKTADDKVPTSSSESQATYVTKFDDKETNEKEDPKIKEEIDQLKDYDVEAVLEKQETHDLFCPNCHSCITKRVILKKRKRTVPNLENKAECHKLVDTVSSKPVESVAQEVNQGDQPNATTEIVSEEQPDDDYNGEREPEVFRCLSCFSFFIPSGRCFNLFRNVGSTREHVTPQNSSSIPSSESQNLSSIPASNSQNSSNVPTSSKSNWLFSLFTPNKGKITSDASIEHSRTTRTEQHHSTPATSNIQTSSVNGLPEAPVADTASAVKTEPWTENSIKSNTVSGNERLTDKKLIDSLFQNDLSSVESDSTLPVSFLEHDSVSVAAATTEIHLNGREPAKYSILNSYDGKPKFPDPTTLLTPLLDKSPREVASYSSPRQGTQALVQSIASDVASYNQGSAIDAIIPSKQDPILNGKENNKGGGDVIVVVDQEAVEFTTSWREDHAPVEAAIIADSHTTSLGEQEMAEIGEPKEWEILKSIVYGGLVESIISLGIVTSAVGSGTAPLNIIALGLANLVGGLVILGNNLWELKDDHSGSGTNQMEINDRYQELLGHRSNFLLHVVVAVVSFQIFGSIPIIVYGVLINKNYYTEVKLAAVVTASLLCVILLAIGKVYTKPQPKAYIKTASYYVTMALVASGVSYIVGNLVQDLLEKLTHSDSGFAIAMSNSGTKTAWMSY